MSIRYFDDIEFVSGGVTPRYCSHLTTRPRDISIEFCSAGGLYHQVDDGPTHELSVPAAFWHIPGHRYRYGPLRQPGWWHHHWVTIRGARAERIASEGLGSLSPHQVQPMDADRGLHRMFVELVGLIHGIRRRQAAAVAVLEQIVAALADASTASDPHDGAIENLAQAMARRPFEAWDSSNEARRLRMSLPHFRRRFTAIVGSPPARHLLQLRMRWAASALIDDPRPVHEVAQALGFHDRAMFTKRFARVLGCSPGRWRSMQTAETAEIPHQLRYALRQAP